ncbi:MAG: hypothetical protein JWN25_1125 [Verrucomicrobiales bacterium]|nr:hypothetical protein [Verrucomicrobiales bacterium]
MNKRLLYTTIVLLSCTIVVMAGAWIWLQKLRVPSSAPGRGGLATSTNLFQRASAKKVVNPKTTVIYRTNQFRWSQIESSDYHAYISNLQAIGCPPQTIKDIIITDIMKVYSSRKGELHRKPGEFKFWETNEKRALSDKETQLRDKELEKIDKEIPGILRELLGINYERELNKYFVDTGDDEKRLSFLDGNKANQILHMREYYEGLQEAVESDPTKSEAEKRQQMARLYQQQKDQLAGVLTREEFSEFNLRSSDTAEKLRGELIGFNPSEPEFRTLYGLRDQMEEKYRFADLSDPAVQQAMKNDQQKMEADIASSLGPDRLAAYEQAKDPHFREVYLFAQKEEIDPKLVQPIVGIESTAREAAAQVLKDRRIKEADKLETVKEIRLESEHTLKQMLGNAYEPYVKQHGEWLKGLAQ